MASPVKIIDAYRNSCIPERFLTGTANNVLAMFANQICVVLETIEVDFNAKYEIEETIRAIFLEKIFVWVKDFPTKEPWSVVNHSTSNLTGNSTKVISTFGFVFVDYQDSENFLKNFIIVEKLTN